MTRIILLALLLAFFNLYCQNSVDSKLLDPEMEKKGKLPTTAQLIGTWVSSKYDSFKKFEVKRVDMFRPISGFSINFDSVHYKYKIEIQYYEQIAIWQFDSLYFQDDILIGVTQDSLSQIGTFNIKNQYFSSFNLIDYSVFNIKSKSNYIKITDCILNCSIESFVNNLILDSTSFPIVVTYNSHKLKLSTSENNCSCNRTLTGLLGYNGYSIIDFYREKNNRIITLAINNTKNERETFKLILGHENYLVKVE